MGDLVSRLSSDVTQMRTMLTTNVTMLLSQVVTLIGSIAIVLSMNARFTLFILALLPVLILVAVVFGRRIQKGSTQIQDQLAASTVVAEEGLQGIRVVKSFGREGYETQRYDNAMQRTFSAALHMAVYNSLFGSVMMFLGFGTIAAIMWYGGREVIAGRLTLAMITGFLMYGISIAGSLAGLGGLYGQISAAVGGVRRVFELLDTEPDVQDAPGAMELPPARGQIAFEDVCFSYDGDDAGAARCFTRCPGRRDPGAGRPQRGRQEHHLQPDPAFLRSHQRGHPHRRARPAGRDAAQPAQPDRHRAAGDDPVRRHDP